MYTRIVVAIDNSTYSRIAETVALEIARAGKIPVTGVHAYTGNFHRTRFSALESHLPEKYQNEDVISHQRDVHSVLITRGLELISLEYMKYLAEGCQSANIPFTNTIIDGKNADVVIDASAHDGLTVMGAEGLGRIEGISGLGSTTRRTLRHAKCDLLIAKKAGPIRSILAGVDGSNEAFSMIGTASDLARILGATLTIAAGYDTGLHRTVFGSLSATLSKEAGNVFKFSEQEELHNNIIDRSLADLYTRHLEHAQEIANDHGIKAETRLMQGKPFLILSSLAEELGINLVVIGHSGMHRSKYSDIGSNTERVVEMVKTNVLVVRNHVQDLVTPGEVMNNSIRGTESDTEPVHQPAIIWNEEAKKRLENVPGFARPMAIMAIERYAREHKITIITPEIMNSAREKLGI